MTAVLTDGPGPADTAAREVELPLTAAQSGMWYAQALDPLSPAQNTAECLEIDGPLDPAVFAKALRQVVAESDALRVRVEDGPDGPRQYVRSHVELPLTVRDVRDARDPEGQALAWMRADLAEPFDLAAGPLFAHALFRVGDERWLWYQRIHHLVMDGYGYSLLVRRTAEVHTALARGEGRDDHLERHPAVARAEDARVGDQVAVDLAG
ncbi:condensation domain-containing protein, partial [Streptomyces sp. NPDC007070]|uniref:condensation domain-containing protein n=1 Tax=Streptomyces sp. NPDC007070 TaxID=3154312 RepID=UPI0033F66107